MGMQIHMISKDISRTTKRFSPDPMATDGQSQAEKPHRTAVGATVGTAVGLGVGAFVGSRVGALVGVCAELAPSMRIQITRT